MHEGVSGRMHEAELVTRMKERKIGNTDRSASGIHTDEGRMDQNWSRTKFESLLVPTRTTRLMTDIIKKPTQTRMTYQNLGKNILNFYNSRDLC
jgi:hypothetical protein